MTVSSQSDSNCIDSVILMGDQDEEAYYESSDWIQSSQIIQGLSSTEYKARDTVSLLTGFEVGLGTEFYGYLDPSACIGLSNSVCIVDGATFVDNTGPYNYQGEICFSDNKVTLYLTFESNALPGGVIIFIPSNNGSVPSGFGASNLGGGVFSKEFNGYALGDAFDISYMIIQDATNTAIQYQTGSYGEILITGCSDGSAVSLELDLEDNLTIVSNTTTQLNPIVTGAVGTVMYEWSPSNSLSAADISNPIASPNSTTTYTLTIHDQNQCSRNQDITVTVIPPPACLVQVGNGGYSTVLPNGEIGPSNESHNPISTLFTNNLQAPYPTTDWWSSLAFPFYENQTHSLNMFPRPLCTRADNTGLRIGYVPDPVVADNNFIFGFAHDLTLSLKNLDADDTKVSNYSDWTVTADWNDGALQAISGHGLPFVYCTKNSTENALIYCSNTPTINHDTGNQLGISVNGKHYGIFGPSGSTWTLDGNDFESTLDDKSYYSVAVLPDASATTFNEYAEHAYTYVTDTNVSWSYNEAQSSLNTTFQFTTDIKEGNESRVLYALFPHHWKNSNQALTTHTYNSGKGTLKVAKSQSFTTTMYNKGILPFMPTVPTAEVATQYTLIDNALNDITFTASGTYWHGKELNKIAQLIPIADQVGHTVARDTWIAMLKADLNDWFTYVCNDDTPLFYYDETVGTFIGFPADFDMNSRLDDHHFHYGYFVMASAILAQYDHQWASDMGGMVELIIQDVANHDKNDTKFPFLRCIDPYAGHSWAGGWSSFWDGNNHESTSEAINFAASVIKWGSETGRSDLEELGMFLYLHETNAAREYWFDVDNTNFPDNFDKQYTALHWGSKADYATWFSGHPEHIHGINYLPITGYSLHLGYDPSYAASNFGEMEDSNGGPVELWIDVLWDYLSFSDPQAALQEFDNNYPYNNGEDGDSPAHTYHWLTNMEDMGTVDDSIRGDMTHSAVFDNSGIKTYVAYNPTSQPDRIVTFNNGVSFLVPSGEIVRY